MKLRCKICSIVSNFIIGFWISQNFSWIWSNLSKTIRFVYYLSKYKIDALTFNEQYSKEIVFFFVFVFDEKMFVVQTIYVLRKWRTIEYQRLNESSDMIWISKILTFVSWTKHALIRMNALKCVSYFQWWWLQHLKFIMNISLFQIPWILIFRTYEEKNWFNFRSLNLLKHS